MKVSHIKSGLGCGFGSALVALCLLTMAFCMAACRETAAGNEVLVRDRVAQVAVGQPYCLELYTSRSEVLLGEPVRLLVSLRNCSSEVLSERDLLAPEYGLLSVWVQRPGSETEELYSPPIRRNGRGRPSIELAPGDALNAELPVYFGSDGWVLDRPGSYRIRAEYPIGKEYIESEPFELRIVNSSEYELAAARAFMQPNASRFYFLSGGDEKGEQQLKQLIEKYPDTIWASYSKLAIELDQTLSGDVASRRVSCQQLYNDEAETLASIPDIVTASNGYKVLVNCLLAAGLYEDAEKTRRRFYERFPQAAEIQALWVDGTSAKEGS